MYHTADCIVKLHMWSYRPLCKRKCTVCGTDVHSPLSQSLLYIYIYIQYEQLKCSIIVVPQSWPFVIFPWTSCMHNIHLGTSFIYGISRWPQPSLPFRVCAPECLCSLTRPRRSDAPPRMWNNSTSECIHWTQCWVYSSIYVVGQFGCYS